MDNGIPIISGYKISADNIEGAKQPSSSLQRNPLVREEDVVAALKEKLAQMRSEVKDNESRWSISEREQEAWDNQKKIPCILSVKQAAIACGSDEAREFVSSFRRRLY